MGFLEELMRRNQQQMMPSQAMEDAYASSLSQPETWGGERGRAALPELVPQQWGGEGRSASMGPQRGALSSMAMSQPESPQRPFLSPDRAISVEHSGGPYDAPTRELPMNSFRNERTGKVTMLNAAPQKPQGDGVEVVQQMQQRDGTILQQIRVPGINGAGQQTMVTQYRTVIPPELDPRFKAKQEMDKRAADMAYTQAQTNNVGRQQPRAPSVQEIVDPKNPGQLIRVDTNVYRPGGSLGDPGVIGVSGREPVSAKREEDSAKGKDLLKSELDNLRISYQTLNNSAAIPSSARSGAENVLSSIRASTPGQMLGRVVGTEQQDARNLIQSSRLRIMNAIKNATGMSAQQMNSNVELQTWLKSLTDPSNSIETNLGIIDALEDAFIKKQPAVDSGGSKSPPKIVDRGASLLIDGTPVQVLSRNADGTIKIRGKDGRTGTVRP